MVDLREARVPLDDRGHLLGDGVFETMRVANGRVFRLDLHLARLAVGLRALGLPLAVVTEARAALDVLVPAGLAAFGDDLAVRLMVTTGTSEAFERAGAPAVTGLCRAFRPYPLEVYERGLQLIVSRERKDSRSALVGAKTLSFLPHLTARREALAAGAHDALLLNEHGRVAEATTANVFAVRDGVVHAPGREEGALAGVTRAVVLELIAELRIAVVERLELASLVGADEAWLTNTLGGILPIAGCDGRRLARRPQLVPRLTQALRAMLVGRVPFDVARGD